MCLNTHTLTLVSNDRAGREACCLGPLGAPGYSLGTQCSWTCSPISAFSFTLYSHTQTHTNTENQAGLA